VIFYFLPFFTRGPSSLVRSTAGRCAVSEPKPNDVASGFFSLNLAGGLEAAVFLAGALAGAAFLTGADFLPFASVLARLFNIELVPACVDCILGRPLERPVLAFAASDSIPPIVTFLELTLEFRLIIPIL